MHHQHLLLTLTLTLTLKPLPPLLLLCSWQWWALACKTSCGVSKPTSDTLGRRNIPSYTCCTSTSSEHAGRTPSKP
jgi:hypothetical protein